MTTIDEQMTRLNDATAAAWDGLLPERLRAFVLDGDGATAPGDYRRMWAEVDAWVVDHELTGHYAASLKSNGVADRCPSWSVDDHEPVVLLHPMMEEDAGRTHHAWACQPTDDVRIDVSASSGLKGLGQPCVDLEIRHGLDCLTSEQARAVADALTQAAEVRDSLA